MDKYKLLISLVFLGFSLTIIGHSTLIDFDAVPATVTTSTRTLLPSSGDRPGRYRYEFTYQYIYGDHQYISDRYTYLGRNTSIAVCNYRVGDLVTAYVNQRNPRYAVIEHRVSGFIYGVGAIGVLMVGHSLLDLLMVSPPPDFNHWFNRLYRWLGAFIGLAILFGGLGYPAYLLFHFIVNPQNYCPNYS
jgi:hypothetical protein